MGRGILIVEPVAATLGYGTGTGPERALTPNPKEAWALPQTAQSAFYVLDLDFGAVKTFDSFFLGYVSVNSGRTWSVENIDSAGGPGAGQPISGLAIAASGYGPPYHAFAKLDTPITARMIRIVVQQSAGSPAFNIGTVQVGLSFQTEYGEERGGGGIIEDTGSVERLFGGGFGIDEGVATTGYSWTFGDLQDAERRQLFQIVKRLRTTRSFLMVENPAQTEGLNERIHWSLFRKLEAYERIDPRNSKWSLSCWDWA